VFKADNIIQLIIFC